MLVVILWVTSSELTQSIFQNKDFNHPFFLTYFSTALFMIYCPFFVRLYTKECKKYCKGNDVDESLYTSISAASHSSSSLSLIQSPNNKINEDSPLKIQPSIECVEYIDHEDNDDHDHVNNNNIKTDKYELEHNDITKPIICEYDSLCIASLDKANKLSLFETFKLSLLFCPVWFSMNWTFNVSLNMTSVASNTILSTMSGPFSLLLSRCLLSTKISVCNLSGVLVTLLGAVFIGYLDDTQSSDKDKHGTVWGDVLALISAFIYGVYVTLIKYKIEDESSVNMFLFFGLLGLINVCTLWPMLLFLDALNYELLAWPDNDVLLLLTLNGLISVGSDYFWAQSILYTSPVVATVAISMMMPIAMIADEIFRAQNHSVLYWSGSFFVMAGFILVNLDFKHQNEEKPKHQNLENKQLSLQQT